MKALIIASIFAISTSFIMKSNVKNNKSDVNNTKWNNYYYKVSSSDSLHTFSVTYQNANDNTTQLSRVRSGYKYQWQQRGKRFLYMSAQCNDEGSSVTVSIYKNGKKIISNSSYGDYVIADVSGEY